MRIRTRWRCSAFVAGLNVIAGRVTRRHQGGKNLAEPIRTASNIIGARTVELWVWCGQPLPNTIPRVQRRECRLVQCHQAFVIGAAEFTANGRRVQPSEIRIDVYGPWSTFAFGLCCLGHWYMLPVPRYCGYAELECREGWSWDGVPNTVLGTSS